MEIVGKQLRKRLRRILQNQDMEKMQVSQKKIMQVC